MSEVKQELGIKAIIKVDGFHDAKQWIYRLVRDRVAKCASCDKPATQVFWQDRAEWYCFCGEHYDGGEMWTGSTRWNPSSFSKNLIPDIEKVKVWRRSLSEDEQKVVRLKKFDATDYYALLDRSCRPTQELYLWQKDKYTWGKLKLYALTDGRFAYEYDQFIGGEHGGRGYSGGLIAPFNSLDEAIEAGKKAHPNGLG